MALFSPGDALQPFIRLIECSGNERSGRLSADQDGTRFPRFPWDLRTVIIVLPPGSPFKYLNINTTLGLTGVPFDQVKNTGGLRPDDCFDLQLCLEDRHEYAVYKRYHSISGEVEYAPGKAHIELRDLFSYSGEWPAYSLSFSDPLQKISLAMKLDSWPGLQWWFYAPSLYCHNTTFATAQVELEWKGKKTKLTTPALHDHGWGKNLLPLRLPVGVFRYEVMRFDQKGHAISLWSEAPLGLRLKNVGLVRPGEENVFFHAGYKCDVLEWEEHENYQGRELRVPAKWRGHHKGEELSFTYEAVRSSEPRAVLGEGLLYAFDFRGEMSGALNKDIKGQGYVEQLGLLA